MSSTLAGTRVDAFHAAVRSRDRGIQIRTDDVDAFAVDAFVPDLSAEPSDEAGLAITLSEAHDAGLAVIPLGGCTQVAYGNIPAAYDVALSLARLRRIEALEAADLTVTADAGVPLVELQAALGEHRQFLPLDAPSHPDATVGGLVATAAAGPLRHRFGAMRDWLIGIRVVQADGTITKAGGRVVKNVSGYEMTKLYTGSLGTLGVISSSTFKVAPLPRVDMTVLACFDGSAAAADCISRATEAGLALYAAELLSPPATNAIAGIPRWAALQRVAGGTGAVERTLHDLRALARDLGGTLEMRDSADAWDSWARCFRPAALALRMHLLPSLVGDTVAVLDRRFAGAAAVMSATVSVGVVRANLEPGSIRALTLIEHARATVERRGGHVVVEAAAPHVKRTIDVFGPLRPDFAIMRRLKEQFDARGVLSPGRFAGRL
jgi:glycolate oxidase FAD binding subunit